MEEKRIDEGKAFTWDEFNAYYKKGYSKKEIASYWETCKVPNLDEEVGIDHVRCGVSSKCATGMHTALETSRELRPLDDRLHYQTLAGRRK